MGLQPEKTRVTICAIRYNNSYSINDTITYTEEIMNGSILSVKFF